MHLSRWLTGIVAVPILVFFVYAAPRWLFYILLFAASVKGLFELFRMSAPEMPAPLKCLAVFLDLLFFYCLWSGWFYQALAVLCLWVILPLTFCLFSSPALRSRASEAVGAQAAAFLYVCLPFALLMVMDRYPRGNVWILFLFTVIFLSDTGAFYFGRFFGKRKLYPSVSPNKTWAGAFGGLFAGVVSGLLFARLFRLGGFPLEIALLAGALSVAGQVGDLVESMLKRNAGVKDSGRILPGHGGLLDRVDGVLFAVPLLYLYLSWSVP